MESFLWMIGPLALSARVGPLALFARVGPLALSAWVGGPLALSAVPNQDDVRQGSHLIKKMYNTNTTTIHNKRLMKHICYVTPVGVFHNRTLVI